MKDLGVRVYPQDDLAVPVGAPDAVADHPLVCTLGIGNETAPDHATPPTPRREAALRACVAALAK